MFNGGKPVGDCDGSPLGPLHDLIQRRLHHPLAGRVERRGGLVQQQHRRLLDDGARDGHALLLPARELAAALTHLGCVPVGQVVCDEGVRIGRARRLLNLVLGGPLGLAIRDVLSNRADEEDRLLAHEPDARAEPAQVERLDVDAVELDAPRRRVVEALEQRDERRLAGARRPAQSNHLPGGDRERVAVADVVVRRGRVGEDHVAHLDGTLNLMELPALLRE
mmetsp:Transcript_5775/g.18397  ORF Transcript_5775/g.18397 Transcript_5775/m.18397 type:complete len:222 (-) Transcript_5775:1594-2259(-)